MPHLTKFNKTMTKNHSTENNKTQKIRNRTLKVFSREVCLE